MNINILRYFLFAIAGEQEVYLKMSLEVYTSKKRKNGVIACCVTTSCRHVADNNLL